MAFRVLNEQPGRYWRILKNQKNTSYLCSQHMKFKSCTTCGINKSRYSCPKCYINYCSVSCYQSENHLQCSETFYEQWVMEELKSYESDVKARRKMLEIFKQNQEMESGNNLDSDDDEIISDLATRMTDVNLDDEEAVWERLTTEEQREFKKLVTNGKILKILPDWEPWWKAKKRKTFIQECDEPFDTECPEVPSQIPKLSKLTKTQPSSNLPFMLLNVLMSYVFTVRWFKGVHKDMPVEGISTCIMLSATLRCNEVFNDFIEAFAAFENDLAKCVWVRNDFNKNLMLEDLADIIKGLNGDNLFCLKAVICDINLLCSQALIVIKENKTNHLKRFSGPSPKVSLLQQISRKMTYFLSWSVDHGFSLIDFISSFS